MINVPVAMSEIAEALGHEVMQEVIERRAGPIQTLQMKRRHHLGVKDEAMLHRMDLLVKRIVAQRVTDPSDIPVMDTSDAPVVGNRDGGRMIVELSAWIYPYAVYNDVPPGSAVPGCDEVSPAPSARRFARGNRSGYGVTHAGRGFARNRRP